MPTVTVKAKPIPTTIRARRGALTKIALDRAKFGDQWVPGYRRTIKQTLDRYVGKVAMTMRLGLAFPDSATDQLKKDYLAAKERWTFRITQAGWDLAGNELKYLNPTSPKSADNWRVKEEATPVLIGGTDPEDLAAREEKDERANAFLQRADFKGINEWVKTTAGGESETDAKRLAEIWKDAVASRDPKTGVAWTTRQMSQAILKRGIAQDKARADMLAHTGTIWAMNEGAKQRYVTAGVTVTEWIASLDDVTCPFCLQFHNQVVSVEDSFWPGESSLSVERPDGKVITLNVPGNVEHPPLHPRCRCTIVPVLRSGRVSASRTKPATPTTTPNKRPVRKRREQQVPEPTASKPIVSTPVATVRENIKVIDDVQDPTINATIEKTIEKLEKRGLNPGQVQFHVTKDASKLLDSRAVAEFNAGTNTITVNANSAVWKNPSLMARAQRKSKFWSEGSAEHVLVHELGHKQHLQNVGLDVWTKKLTLTKTQQTRIRKEVSRYAAVDQHEFVSEVYAGLSAGRKYSSWVMSRYRVFGGFV